VQKVAKFIGAMPDANRPQVRAGTFSTQIKPILDDTENAILGFLSGI